MNVANVLIIEDDVPLQEAYTFILKSDGHEVDSAFNGKEGLALVQAHHYDIILLDLHMPVMDGWAFLKRFKKNPPKNTKVVVFSNMVEPDLEKQASELGAFRSVLKSSVTPTSMAALIREAAKVESN